MMLLFWIFFVILCLSMLKLREQKQRNIAQVRKLTESILVKWAINLSLNV